MTTLELPVVDFVPCAHAGPLLVDHPGRRLCGCPKLRTPNGLGVSAAFCANCPPKYRTEPKPPVIAWEQPTRFRLGDLSVYRERPCAEEGGVLQTCASFPVTDPRSEWRHRRICLNEAVMTDGCTREYVGEAWQACARCPHYQTEWPLHFDQGNLAPHLPGRRFNASLLARGGGYLLAWRSGWKGSEIFLSELDRDFRTTGRHAGPLALRHAEAGYGREDPRLFLHDGALHVAFIGVVGGGNRIRHTSQLYARLRDDFTVEAVHCPHYAGRNLWEKNWQFFSHDGVLYAVYTAAPHRVLRIEGDTARPAFETAWAPGWEGGEIRGGAAPVRVGAEYWCFFHDRVRGAGGRLVYRMGLYTFEAAPPFRPRRIVRAPLLSADAGTFRVPHDNYCDVVFPGGAVRDGERWVVAAGVHDRWAELHRLDHAGLDSRLVDVGPAAAASGVAGDVLVAALLTRGSDPFHSGRKVRGSPCRTGELSAAELGDYLAPFAATVGRWGVRGVILHDGLPADFIASHPSLTFSRVDPAGVHNYERRWFAWRDWLEANPGVARAWLVDVNDVYFTRLPFAAIEGLPAGHVAAAVEPGWTYASKEWYADQLRRLPAEYSDCLLGRHGEEHPLNCGAWAADAATAREVCRLVCAHLGRLEAHAAARHPETPVVCDMIAFGRVLLDDFAGRVRPVRTDGDPLIHDRPLALAAMGAGARSCE